MRFDPSISENEEEHLCNLFASEILIPEGTFKREIGESRADISYPELRALQVRFGISCDALMYKANRCNVISNQRYRSFCNRKNSNPSYKELIERSLYPMEESHRFPSLVYRALSNELITVSKAASLLHTGVEQVREATAYV